MRPVDQEPGVDRVLADLFGIELGQAVRHGQRRAAAAARHHTGAGGGGKDVHTARHLERLEELSQVLLVGRLGDEEHGVLALHHRLAQDLHPVPPHVGAAQMVEEHGAQVGILGRAALPLVAVADDEQRHVDLSQ